MDLFRRLALAFCGVAVIGSMLGCVAPKKVGIKFAVLRPFELEECKFCRESRSQTPGYQRERNPSWCPFKICV